MQLQDVRVLDELQDGDLPLHLQARGASRLWGWAPETLPHPACQARRLGCWGHPLVSWGQHGPVERGQASLGVYTWWDRPAHVAPHTAPQVLERRHRRLLPGAQQGTLAPPPGPTQSG